MSSERSNLLTCVTSWEKWGSLIYVDALYRTCTDIGVYEALYGGAIGDRWSLSKWLLDFNSFVMLVSPVICYHNVWVYYMKLMYQSEKNTSRAVTIHSTHDWVRIMIVDVWFDMTLNFERAVHDTAFLHDTVSQLCVSWFLHLIQWHYSPSHLTAVLITDALPRLQIILVASILSSSLCPADFMTWHNQLLQKNNFEKSFCNQDVSWRQKCPELLDSRETLLISP